MTTTRVSNHVLKDESVTLPKLLYTGTPVNGQVLSVDGSGNFYFADNTTVTSEDIDDRISALINAGTHENITIIYDDLANSLSFVVNDFVSSVNTKVGDVVLNTDDISEGSTNLYYTNARVDARIALNETNDYVNDASFNIADGNLTLERTGILPDIVVNFDGRYLTAESDTLSDVLARGNVATGGMEIDTLTVNSEVVYASYTASVSSTSQTEISNFSSTLYRSSKMIIQAVDTVTSEIQISEINIVQDGTNAYGTEYGTIYTGAARFSNFDMSLSGGAVRIYTTNTSSNTTEFVISATLIK